MKYPIFIAGPCVIESQECLEQVAQELVRINKELGTEIIFKASFDKANRTSITSFRGPGMEKGLQMLADIKAKYGLKLLTDIHESDQAAPVAEVVDVLQIPAFLCRQTDLLVTAAKTGKTVNIKKAQFLSGLDMQYPVQKVRETQQTLSSLPLREGRGGSFWSFVAPRKSERSKDSSSDFDKRSEYFGPKLTLTGFLTLFTAFAVLFGYFFHNFTFF